MTQHTYDEKVALVEKAKGIVEERVEYMKYLHGINALTEHRMDSLRLNYNSWLAHKAFFERHEEYTMYSHEGGYEIECAQNGEHYPCLELVTTADLIVNGVKE